MKKTLLIALAGLMLIAFTQCGSKDYRTMKKFAKTYKSELKKAKTCEDLDKIDEKMEEKVEELVLKNNLDIKKLSEKEQKKLRDLDKEIEEISKEKEKELCKD